MYKRVLRTNGSSDPEVLWQADIADAGDTGETALDLEVGDTIGVQMLTLDSFGTTTSYAAQFKLLDPDGVAVDLGAGDFSSGTTDWGTQAMYDCTVAYYTSHTYRNVCLD